MKEIDDTPTGKDWFIPRPIGTEADWDRIEPMVAELMTRSMPLFEQCEGRVFVVQELHLVKMLKLMADLVPGWIDEMELVE